MSPDNGTILKPQSPPLVINLPPINPRLPDTANVPRSSEGRASPEVRFWSGAVAGSEGDISRSHLSLDKVHFGTRHTGTLVDIEDHDINTSYRNKVMLADPPVDQVGLPAPSAAWELCGLP
jgi:hypothetical protein